MDLATALKGIESAQEELRQPIAISNPGIISDQMYRLGQYTAGAEYHLAELERSYEEMKAATYRKAIKVEGVSATAADKEVKIELGAIEGELKYLTRLVNTAWKIHMSCMARHKHLINERPEA